MSHWHVTAGEDAYTVADIAELCHVIQGILSEAAEQQYETAHIDGDAGEYQSAWEHFTRSETLSLLAATFSPARMQAPLYREYPEKWPETVRQLLDTHIPIRLGDHSALWVGEDDCDWVSEED